MTQMKIYSVLYVDKVKEYKLAGYTQDKASRMANKFCVQNTRKVWEEKNYANV